MPSKLVAPWRLILVFAVFVGFSRKDAGRTMAKERYAVPRLHARTNKQFTINYSSLLSLSLDAFSRGALSMSGRLPTRVWYTG
ncbi:hypothetical protein EDD85DRAFT_264863 [Armillaria nabsnona]|nr:hypothetical protein EDD85DRAFT_264863 [Armillaria nabsnona]